MNISCHSSTYRNWACAQMNSPGVTHTLTTSLEIIPSLVQDLWKNTTLLCFKTVCSHFSASAALAEPAGLSITKRWDNDSGLSEPDQQGRHNNQPDKPYSINQIHSTNIWEANVKFIHLALVCNKIFLILHLCFTVLEYMVERELK